MSLQDRLGSMIKTLFIAVGILTLFIIFSLCWCSAFLGTVNNKFFTTYKKTKSIRDNAAIAVATAVSFFFFFIFFCVLMYFFGHYLYLHWIAIILLFLSFVAHLTFICFIIINTKSSELKKIQNYYITNIVTNKTDNQNAIKWMKKHNCDQVSVSCDDQVKKYFKKIIQPGFIVTCIDTALISLVVITLVIVVSLMSCIQPEEHSDDLNPVTSSFLNDFTLIPDKIAEKIKI